MIAYSGSSGSRSTGPHLHFELASGKGPERVAVNICPLLGNPSNCVSVTTACPGEEIVGEEYIADIPLPGPASGMFKGSIRLVV